MFPYGKMEKKNDTDSSSSSNMMCGSIAIRLVVATMVKEQNPQSYQMELSQLILSYPRRKHVRREETQICTSSSLNLT
jgi:hypothetical protein